MKRDELAAAVHQAFVDNSWEFTGYGVPELEDVKLTIDNCIYHLESKPDGTTIEVQNIVMRKESESYHFYIRLGVIDD